MIKKLEYKIAQLEDMKKYPQQIHYIGNTQLLKKRKVSIVGTRHPSQYTKIMTQKIASKLASMDICIVSGGAMGVDAIAHRASGVNNTIMVAGTGLDIRYPKINSKLIQEIEENALVISQFEKGSPSKRYNFPLRNELIVALGDILIVTQADLNSGTMRSVEYALGMKKEIYVLSHRVGESVGTNELLLNNKAKGIYDIDKFIEEYTGSKINTKELDEFLLYAQNNPKYDEAIKKYPSRVFEAELNGEIEIKEAIIYLK